MLFSLIEAQRDKKLEGEFLRQPWTLRSFLEQKRVCQLL